MTTTQVLHKAYALELDACPHDTGIREARRSAQASGPAGGAAARLTRPPDER
ncbi:MAG TPA: hypothetical protein VMH26_17950 [Burkholderiales bacterium]|nr:hypothetical protein [Burkholderiales bacterium]